MPKAVQESHHLATRTALIRAEMSVVSALCKILFNRPSNCLCIERLGIHINEWRNNAYRFRTSCGTPQESNDLASGAGRIGFEMGTVSSVCNTMVNCKINPFMCPIVFYIYKT